MNQQNKPVQQDVVDMLANVVKPNPLLARLRVPGSTYRLPSQGVFYLDGELDATVKNGEVEVRPMTAIDEIILSTPDKLLSGRAIEEIFARCVPQVLKPRQLLSQDVDYLMVCLREVSFGQFMEVSFQHDCEKALRQSYNVDLHKMIRSTKSLDPTTVSHAYTVEMENGQVVHLKPFTYGDVVDMYEITALSNSEEITTEQAEQMIVTNMVNVIARVDDTDDRELIREWLISIPLGWKKKIATTASSIETWGISFTTEQTCKDCKKKMEVQISANPVNFFT